MYYIYREYPGTGQGGLPRSSWLLLHYFVLEGYTFGSRGGRVAGPHAVLLWAILSTLFGHHDMPNTTGIQREEPDS